MENLLYILAGIAWLGFALVMGRTVMNIAGSPGFSMKRTIVLILLSYGLGLFMLLLLVAGTI